MFSLRPGILFIYKRQNYYFFKTIIFSNNFSTESICHFLEQCYYYVKKSSLLKVKSY